jgi:hypothetical protein|nr:MAG TPA: hypothetical protein [Caudoviricetes sp.]
MTEIKILKEVKGNNRSIKEYSNEELVTDHKSMAAQLYTVNPDDAEFWGWFEYQDELEKEMKERGIIEKDKKYYI